MRLNYINSKKKQKEKEHLRIVINSVEVCVVSKTNDEVYVSNTTKMCIYFSFVLSDMPTSFPLAENIESDVATSKTVTTMQKW